MNVDSSQGRNLDSAEVIVESISGHISNSGLEVGNYIQRKYHFCSVYRTILTSRHAFSWLDLAGYPLCIVSVGSCNWWGFILDYGRDISLNS